MILDTHYSASTRRPTQCLLTLTLNWNVQRVSGARSMQKPRALGLQHLSRSRQTDFVVLLHFACSSRYRAMIETRSSELLHTARRGHLLTRVVRSQRQKTLDATPGRSMWSIQALHKIAACARPSRQARPSKLHGIPSWHPVQLASTTDTARGVI